MEHRKINRLFSYKPDADQTKKRLIAQARELYQWGLGTEKHQPQVTDITGKLKNFYLYLTFDCPFRCSYCYADGGVRRVEELDADSFLRITKEAIDAGYRTIVVVGGEPLIYRMFDEYLEGLRNLKHTSAKFVLRSSLGFPIEERKLRDLSQVFDEIVVSIDGDEQTHDAVRGKGTWYNATEQAKRIIAMGGRISVHSVLRRDQFLGEEGDCIKSFCRALKIEKLTIQSPLPLGRAAGAKEESYRWCSVTDKIEEVKPVFSCGLGRGLYVLPDGNVYPCYAWCEKEYCLGDLSKQPLKEIVHSDQLISVFNYGVESNEKCCTCEVRYFCGGMCKIFNSNKTDIDSGAFDCSERKQQYLDFLKQYGIL